MIVAALDMMKMSTLCLNLDYDDKVELYISEYCDLMGAAKDTTDERLHKIDAIKLSSLLNLDL